MALFGSSGNDIRIRFIADTSEVGAAVTETGAGISKGLGLASLGWAAAGVAAGEFARQSIDAAMEAEDAQNRLAASYAKFPALHDVSLQALNDLADATQKKTRYDDEAARAAEEMLAQYHLTGSQLVELLPLVEDFAAKTGKTLPDAATAIGKALLGNTRALKEVGISYKSTGDEATDFTNIVALLREQVGGFAEKDAQTTSGKMEMLKNQFGELQEKIGSALLPLIGYIAPALIAILEVLVLSMQGWGMAFSAIGDVATSVGQIVASVLQVIVDGALWVIGAFNTVAGAVAAAGGVVASVFGGAVSWVTDLLHDIWGVLTDVAHAVSGVFAGAFNAAKGAVDGVAGAVEWLINKLHGLKSVWDSVSGFIGKLGSIVGLSAPAPPPGGAGAPSLALAGTAASRGLSGASSSATAPLVVNVNVHGNVGDPNLIGRRVVDALATYSRTNGARALRTNIGLT